MKTLIKISWRNIWRNRTRSLILIMAIILGLTGGVFSAAIRLGAEKQRFQESVENQISHIQIHHPQFIANPELRFPISDGYKIADEIAVRSGVKGVSPRSVFDGMAASASQATGVRIKGIDPAAESGTTMLDGLIEEGSFFAERGRIPSIITGQALARDLNSGVGSRIVLTFQDADGGMVSASFRIEGLYSVTAKRFEERTVFIKAEDLEEFLDGGSRVTEIAVLLENHDDYRRIAEELREAYPGLEIRHWGDIDPSLYFALEFLERNLLWIMGIIIFGVSFGLLNTVLMSVLERVRELGVLMAVGMKKSKVFTMVMLETTMVSLIGGVIGLISAYGLVEYLKRRGVDLSGIAEDGMGEYGFATVIYPEVEPAFYFQIAVLIIIFAVLASIYPAWKAIRLVPADAVRQE